ncbi:MAG: putative transport system ATP-binding protein [Solirubrobacterales bacterium]|jgi:predicted ABC-type transport system involved in lysophospholipase L1 biosynthesis ATPase subunit|nr:putative transport system ATP-binding protein [Solirubrobacterales bacterium]
MGAQSDGDGLMAVVASREAALAGGEGVSVSYGRGPARVDALVDVDLEIAAGETVALRGPSGSGKTTLLHVLGGLVEPSAGEVRWRGGPLSSLDASARGRARSDGIAYVFQSPSLMPYFTAYENVAFAIHSARATGEGTDPERLLAVVGLGDKLDSLPGELSGGEAQRAAIARALGQRPELLLCDEPTGHLDSDTAERVLDLIGALQQELGFALVVATHDPTVAERCARRVELADGRVVGDEGAA